MNYALYESCVASTSLVMATIATFEAVVRLLLEIFVVPPKLAAVEEMAAFSPYFCIWPSNKQN